MTNLRFIVFLFILLSSGCQSLSPQGIAVPSVCSIQSFIEFAYEGPKGRNSDLISPEEPWTVNLKSDEVPETSYMVHTRLARFINNHTEIWIELGEYGRSASFAPQFEDGRFGFGIYSPQSRSFEQVSHYVGDTEFYVVNLFKDSNNAVWGEVFWDLFKSYGHVIEVPVLSKFNEDTRQFEFVPNVPEISVFVNSRLKQIIIAPDDTFWILADGRIHRYDTITKDTLVVSDIPEDVVYSALATDGTIYFSLFIQDMSLSIPQDGLYQLSPKTREITIVEVPDQFLPMYKGLWSDQKGRLWLGSMATRGIDDEWVVIHPPYLNTWRDHYGQYMWSAPAINSETSDGRLWLYKYLDSNNIAEGTAWFDPETGEGCLVTNYPTYVVEDDHQQLWMVVDEVLYSAPVIRR